MKNQRPRDEEGNSIQDYDSLQKKTLSRLNKQKCRGSFRVNCTNQSRNKMTRKL